MIILRLPPLRERGDDILLLAEHFLRQLQRQVRQGVRAASIRGRRELLLAYPWPGNVRELSHVMERAVCGAGATCSAVEHLSLEHPARPTPVEPAPSGPIGPGSLGAVLPPPGMDLEPWERTLIERHCGSRMATRPGRPSDSASAGTRSATG